MTRVTAEAVLQALEHEPAAPFSATTLRLLADHPSDHLWTPRWWRLDTPTGLPTLGLVAMQVASGGHPHRLEQAWAQGGPAVEAVSLDGPLPLGGLLWLVGTRSTRLNRWVTETLTPHLVAQGGSVEAVWHAAWRASGAMRTQNAVDLPWNDVLLAWAQDQDYRVPRPAAPVGATLGLTWMQAHLRELSPDRVWDEHIVAEPASPVIPWLVANAPRPEAVAAWLTPMLTRKRKVVPLLEQAFCDLLSRGATVTLPKRADAVVPLAVAAQQATERARSALAQGPAEPTRGRRLRS